LTERDWTYTQLVWQGRVGDFQFSMPAKGQIAPAVTITTGRWQPSARAVINLTNFRHQLTGKIEIGDPVSWSWNYVTYPRAEVEIFSGYVASVTDAERLVVEARDRMRPVLDVRRTVSFNRERPGNILEWFLAEAGVRGRVYHPEVILPHFAARNLNASEAAEHLNAEISRQTGLDTSDWDHFLDQAGRFVWGPFKGYSQNEIIFKYLFKEGGNADRIWPARGGRLGRLIARPVPAVRHSMLADIELPGQEQIQARMETVIFRQEARNMEMEMTWQPWPPEEAGG